METLNQKLSSIFHTMFAIIFGITVFLVIGVYILRYPLCIPAALIMGVAVLHMLKRFLSKEHTRIQLWIIGLFFVMLALQIFLGWLLRITPGNDRNVIFSQAVEIAESGIWKTSPEWNYYFLRYPNNRILVLLQALWFSVCKTVGIKNYLMANIMINIAMIDLSIVCILRMIRKIRGQKAALFFMILSVLFVPYYLYGPFVYTDSLTLPIVAGAILLYYKLVFEKENFFQKGRLQKASGFLLLTFLLWLGYVLKATIVIMLLAFVIHLLCIKRARGLLLATGMLCIFMAFQLAGTTIIKQAAVFDETDFDTENFPYTHWVMMGLKGVGNYDKREREFTSSFKTREDKKQANLKVIKERLNDYNVHGLLIHQLGKGGYTWSNGLYDMEFYLNKNPIQKNPLQKVVFSGSKYLKVLKIYTEGYQLVLLTAMLVSILAGVKRKRMDIYAVASLAVFGLYMFLMLWETRPRYLMHFVPLMFLIALEGLFTILDNKKRLPRIMHKLLP